jgi:hypothetical protein
MKGSGGAHRGRGVAVAAALIPDGVATMPAVKVDRRQESGRGLDFTRGGIWMRDRAKRGHDIRRRLLSLQRAVGEGEGGPGS